MNRNYVFCAILFATIFTSCAKQLSSSKLYGHLSKVKHEPSCDNKRSISFEDTILFSTQIIENNEKSITSKIECDLTKSEAMIGNSDVPALKQKCFKQHVAEQKVLSDSKGDIKSSKTEGDSKLGLILVMFAILLLIALLIVVLLNLLVNGWIGFWIGVLALFLFISGLRRIPRGTLNRRRAIIITLIGVLLFFIAIYAAYSNSLSNLFT
jgi:hypothetical protein